MTEASVPRNRGIRAGVAYFPAFFAGMYAPLRWVRAKEQHVC
jgi:hypothetical protein